MKNGNSYTGEVPLKISDELEGTLKFDWAALGAIKEQFGNEGQPEMPANLMDMNPVHLATLAALGFKVKSPHITAEKIMEASPPMLSVAQAVDHALLIAYHGPERAKLIHDQMAGITEAADVAAGTAAGKKKKKTS